LICLGFIACVSCDWLFVSARNPLSRMLLSPSPKPRRSLRNPWTPRDEYIWVFYAPSLIFLAVLDAVYGLGKTYPDGDGGCDWVVHVIANTYGMNFMALEEDLKDLLPMRLERDDAEEFLERMEALQSEYQVKGVGLGRDASGVYHDKWIVVLSLDCLE